jgi:hypothetical protein
MPDREESREEWEKEIIDVQHSVTFPEALRSAQIIAKNSASPAPVQDFPHPVRFAPQWNFAGYRFCCIFRQRSPQHGAWRRGFGRCLLPGG